jgi:His-Xaa-Ser system radical SAM maturase HxsC
MKVDDIDLLFSENLLRIQNAPNDLPIIGITGGEPTLLGDKLISLVKRIRERLPNTDIHILSNGRNFKNLDYTSALVDAGEGHIIFGIPLHSDFYRDHDIIAGVKGAFEETITGLYNLASVGACIELRIVMNKLNYKRFLQLAEFIHKNLPFVAWIAFMGMEYTGYAIKNAKSIWIEPKEYVAHLLDAVKYLDEWHYNVCIYNIPLCLLPDKFHKFAQKSISDWKNDYTDICQECKKKEMCCGLFTTSIKPYVGLKAIQ